METILFYNESCKYLDVANSLYTKFHIISKSKTNKVNVLYNYIDFDFFENKLSKAVPNNLIELKNRF